jgi:CBS domain-containing protein
MHSTVKDVMSTHVIAVRRSAPYKELAAMLHAQRVSAFPVVDEDNKVIGVVSEADLLTKEALEAGASGGLGRLVHPRERSKADAVTAAELMTRPPVTIGPDEPVAVAARLMRSRRVKRLPVVSDDGRLIGIVSRSDVLSVFSRTDEQLRREITEDVILGSFLCDPAPFTVTVTDGVVTLEGTPETAVIGRDIIDAARHVEGVIAVRDRLSYPPEVPYRPIALL